ncbi:MAG: regulatory protein RecX [Crocinitomicaceae bacterium]|jgi:regulatory protein
MNSTAFSREQIIFKLEAFCAYQERCVSEVRTKLERLGADESLVREVTKYLQDNRFLDENRFVEAYVQGKLRIKKWGRQKIKAGLFQKRVDAKLIQEGIYAFISDEEYQQVIESLIERKNRELSTEKNPQIKKQKLMRFLLSRGFQYDEFSSLCLD